ncbi:MAG: DUF4956 domain-containing protein [Deltaproteobacteria bacterium]|nr:DUF4956 domain-containing protein [Deltaproteobacteria bacterium]
MESLLQHLSNQDFDPASPQSWAYVIMLLISLLYGIMLNLLYSLYFRDNEPRDASLARSLVLLTPTLMTIFWVVQFSLPLSVGLLGTLSFVRFRSPVKRAEDISFIVIALACSISCAISKPLIGGGLILLFIVYSFFRNYMIPAALNGKNFAVLTYNTKLSTKIGDIEEILTSARCSDYEFVSSRSYDGITSFVFNVGNLRKNSLAMITEKLRHTDAESKLSVFYPNGRLGV